MPVIRVNGEDLEGAGDVCFGSPGSLACEINEDGGMVYGCVLHGEVWAGDEAINAWKGEPWGTESSIMALFFPE